MFGSSSAFGASNPGTGGFGAANQTGSTNPMKDFEVSAAPDDSVSCLRFSPPALNSTFLIAGSWDNNVRLWEIQANGTSEPRHQQSMQGPILDVCWQDDGSKVFMASCDKQVKMWDLGSNQTMQVAEHGAPIKSIRWVKAPNYTALMTGSWDKTLKFWDTRSPNPIMSIDLGERCYCADVDYPMAVVGTAGRGIIIYSLEGQPKEFKRIEPPLKYQHRCISVFKDKKGQPTGFALGSVEGRVAIQYANATNPKDNFTFKCHRSNGVSNGFQDIYAVNDLAFHPQHGTLATVGSDGRFSFWDKDARTKLKTSEPMDQPITACSFSSNGQIFAYAVSYDWSRGHEFYNPQKKNYIFLRPCFDDLKPRAKP
ncbi:hypothetical protein TCAL_00993 [Tigriopus californicus]|uniref:Uncharacterized protein n=1 Tax=Tigriopus californicus TaxID=6832 RepID=A0A553P4F8_TIGCA|nr:protein Rae1-like [Tigriopus californicus]TRY72553.1 hypothetical protein TCAL_00993 [Tigriopus californicus]|eukprot:TCALIF_00993-PA protein Name:"Similar to RAE1 mRNA export factor (Pongo abelii)" AED:0.07 eAED:0.07 QI:0/0/0/1/1/1/4/0/367